MKTKYMIVHLGEGVLDSEYLLYENTNFHFPVWAWLYIYSLVFFQSGSNFAKSKNENIPLILSQLQRILQSKI